MHLRGLEEYSNDETTANSIEDRYNLKDLSVQGIVFLALLGFMSLVIVIWITRLFFCDMRDESKLKQEECDDTCNNSHPSTTTASQDLV